MKIWCRENLGKREYLYTYIEHFIIKRKFERFEIQHTFIFNKICTFRRKTRPSRPTMRPLWMNFFYEWMFFLWINVICEWMNDWMTELLYVCFFYRGRTTFLLKICLILMFLMNALPTNRPTDTASYRVACPQLKTSDAGLQYRRGRLGRGIHPPSTSQPQRQSQIKTPQVSRPLVSPLFNLIITNGRTDGRTDE